MPGASPASPISLEHSVQEIMVAWPQTIPVFLRNHMNCVGCSMAAFETLGEALRIYNLDSRAMLAQLNAAISNPTAPAGRASQPAHGDD